MSRRIRVAIAGVGNCASSLVQGIEYYRDAQPGDSVPGLMHVELGGYHVRDVEVVCAFDVDAAKVGLDVGKAIFSGQNNTIRFASVGELGIQVQRGPTNLVPARREGRHERACTPTRIGAASFLPGGPSPFLGADGHGP